MPDNQTTDLTHKEVAALRYLTNLMESPALAIGRAIWSAAPGKGSNLPNLGAAVCGRLRKRGYVDRLPDLKAWRITASGRLALQRLGNAHDQQQNHHYPGTRSNLATTVA